jgi:hypothetical protein
VGQHPALTAGAHRSFARYRGTLRAGYDAAVADLEALTADDFAPHLHQRFRLSPAGAAPFDVELIEVAEADGGGARSPFSLVFRGGPSPPLPQQIHRTEHEALGALNIFLVPLGPDEVGQRYEAVFT